MAYLDFGRTFVPLFDRRPNLCPFVWQEVPTEASLRRPRQEAEVRLAALLSRRQAGTGGSGRTIVTSFEVLCQAKAFAMLGALAWQADLQRPLVIPAPSSASVRGILLLSP